MVQIKNNNFSLAQISESGQCFRMNELNGGRYGLTAHGRYLELMQKEDVIFFDCAEEEFEQIWKEYFDLNTDYGKIIALADDKDLYLQKAADYGKGIRILKQDAWEMVISFIISQQNNIKRIRRCIDLLCTRYGEELHTKEGRIYYAFPTPESLAAASLEELYACNLGYRSRYVKQSAQSIATGEVDLEKVGGMEYPHSVGELKKLCGVGDKVADCISLFGLHQLEAFPKDVHINRVLEKQYPDGFPFEKYKGYAGVLQQYLFYYDLTV
ncbi:MAG: 8-oxoguanine DNA glycosylase [Lachnoclostridium sp.]|nr:8-oxoguanine DNA glycosylase [Lachnospira sp.]MCM1248347.1 8-oxoguanine DNA glycosylase [Lachnoclostridium sp.]MCM1536192.1 8-oxoguanine DNA glycosylase [Clostridium sp.]